MDQFDPERLKLPPGAVGNAKPSKRPPRHRKGEQFLWGPIPWLWVSAAAKLPGRALHVSLVLWRLAGIKKDCNVRWEPSAGKYLGVNRWAAHRGLAALERAGLVAVERRRGRSPIVTILEKEPDR